MEAWKARLTSAQKEELVMILAKLKQAKIGVSQDGANLRIKFQGLEPFDAKGNVDVYSLSERLGINLTSLDSSYTKLGSIEQIKLKSAVSNILSNATNQDLTNTSVASYSLHLSNALESNGIKTDFDPKTATVLAFILAHPRYESLFDGLNSPKDKEHTKFRIVKNLIEDLEAIGVKLNTEQSPKFAVVDDRNLTKSGSELVFSDPDVIRNYALKLANEAKQPIGLVMKFHRTCIQRSLSVALNGEPTLPQEFMSPSVREGLVSLFHSVKSGDNASGSDFLSNLRFVDDSGRDYANSFDLAMEDKLRLRKGAFVSHLDKVLTSQSHLSSDQKSSIMANVDSIFDIDSFDSDIKLYVALDAIRESSRLLSSHFASQPYESMISGVKQFRDIVQAPYSSKSGLVYEQKNEKPLNESVKPQILDVNKEQTQNTTSAPKPETKPAPKPAPAPKPETKPAPKPASAPKPETKSAPKPASAPKPETKSATKPEVKAATKPEAKSLEKQVPLAGENPSEEPSVSKPGDDANKEANPVNFEVATKALDAFKGELIDKCFRGDDVELPDVMDWVEKRWRDVVDSMTDSTPEDKLNKAQVEFYGLSQSRNFRKSTAWYEQSIERFEMSSEINRDITKILESLQNVNSDDPKISESLAMYQGAMLENLMPILADDGTVHPLADLVRVESARNGVRDGLMPIAKAILENDLEPLTKYATLLEKKSESLKVWKENATSPESDNALAHHWEALFPNDKALTFEELEKGINSANDLISSKDTVAAMIEKPVEEGSGSLSMVWDKEQLIGTTESTKPKAYEHPTLKPADDFLRVELEDEKSLRPSLKH